MTSFLPLLVCWFGSQGSPLDDPRLAAHVTLVAPAESVEKVLAEVGRQCGMTLEAAGAIEDDVVIAAVKDVSAAQFLSRLAEHFGWQWVKVGSTLRLDRSVEAAKVEERLADEARIRPFVELQRRLRGSHVELSPQERAQIETEINALQEKMGQLAQAENQEAWQEHERLSKRHFSLTRKLEASARLIEQVVCDLSTEQLRAMVTRGRLVFSTKPTSAQLGMSAKAKQLAAEHVQQAAERGLKQLRHMDAEGEHEAQVRSSIFAQPSSATAVRVTLRALEGSGPGLVNREFSGISVDVAILGDSGEVLTSQGEWMDAGYSSSADAGAAPASEQPRTPFRAFEDPRFQQPLDGQAGLKEQLSLFAFPGEDFSAVIALIGHMTNLVNEGHDPIYPLAKVLTEAAKASGTYLLADGYDSNIIGCIVRRLSGRLKDLKSVLTEVCRAAGWSPSFQDNWLTLRTRDWALARRATVPRRLLRELVDLHQRQSGISVDQVADFVSRMSDQQATAPLLGLILLESWPVRPENVSLVRAYATLGAVQKELLRQGEPLSFAAIAPGPRALLGEHLYRVGAMVPAEAASATNEARIEEAGQEIEPLGGRHRDWEVTQILPAGPTPLTTLRLAAKSEPGIAFQFSASGRTLQAGLPVSEFAEVSVSMAEQSQQLPFEFRIEGVRAGTTDVWNFAILHPGLFSSSTNFRQTYCSPAAGFGAADALPEPHRTRLAEAIQKIKQRRAGGGGGSGGENSFDGNQFSSAVAYPVEARVY